MIAITKSNLILPTLCLLCCCCHSRQSMQSAQSYEAVTVQHVTDTVFVELPHESLQASVPSDSVSFLQTSAAASTARLTPDGRLEHRLYTRDTVITVPVPTIIRSEVRHADSASTRTTKTGTPDVALLILVLILSLILILYAKKPS